MGRNRKLNRLKDYNYSTEGYYFVTVCTKDRQEWFGEIKKDAMVLNECGELAKMKWLEIPDHFEGVVLDQYVIMPNHMHGIIIINDNVGNRHARLASRAKRACSLQRRQYQTLPVVMGSYKSAVTKSVHQMMNDTKFQWQKSFHDHIIRNEEDLMRICEYITNNPLQWAEDIENILTTKK